MELIKKKMIKNITLAQLIKGANNLISNLNKR